MRRLTRRYGPRTALDDLSLTVPSGTFVALLGPNGAGKTTLLRVLATLERPDAGDVHVAGWNPTTDAPAVRRAIGLVAHRPLLYPDLTAEENLRFFARLYGVAADAERLRAALAGAGLLRRRHDRVRAFSRGMGQRLAIARALLHDPPLLLLDEPHTGLDPESADRLDATLRQLVGAERTVLMTTHDLARAHALADRLLVLDHGRITWSGVAEDVTAEALAAHYRARRVAGEAAAPATPSTSDRGARSEATTQTRTPEAPAVQDVRSDRRRSDRRQSHRPQATRQQSDPAGRDRPPSALPPAGAGALTVIAALAAKDLRAELRAREIVPPVAVFSLLTAAVLALALPQPGQLGPLAPGALWVALLFGSTLGLSRAMAGEVEHGGMTALLLSPADRGALFAGKWLSGYAWSALVAAFLLPTFVVLLGLPPAGLPALAGVVALALVGWVAAGVLLGAMAVHTRAREVLLPVLLYPLVLPLLIPAVTASAAVLGLGEPGSLGPALALVAAYDVVFFTLGFLFFPFVVEG